MGKEGIKIEAGEVEITIRVAEHAKRNAEQLAKGAEAKWNGLVDEARRAGHG